MVAAAVLTPLTAKGTETLLQVKENEPDEKKTGSLKVIVTLVATVTFVAVSGGSVLTTSGALSVAPGIYAMPRKAVLVAAVAIVIADPEMLTL